MDSDRVETQLAWFLLFPLNTWLGNPYHDSTVAMVIVFMHSLTYMIFVKYTIDQITEYLDINCLSFKYGPTIEKTKKKQ